jgi:hypothetical protein
MHEWQQQAIKAHRRTCGLRMERENRARMIGAWPMEMSFVS